MTALRVLVTGGAGYIGSHTSVALLDRGHDVVIVDDLSNSHAVVIDRIAAITGRRPVFVHGRVQEPGLLDATLAEHPVDAAIHFAAYKAVGESVAKPLAYYANNLGGLVALAEALGRAGAKRLVFSSSATVYGDPDRVPIAESATLRATNPYGRTKLYSEHILEDLQRADAAWQITLLRYFNPVGAHPSGLIGEDPQGIPNNLMPFIAQVAVGRRAELQVFGGDWPTPDGTGVRDYLHVVDLARAHVLALERAAGCGLDTINVGTGRGHSVLEVIDAFARASGRPVPYRIVSRRPGDVAALYADPSRARDALGWSAEHDLDTMCRDSWHWQSRNPDGYRTTTSGSAT